MWTNSGHHYYNTDEGFNSKINRKYSEKPVVIPPDLVYQIRVVKFCQCSFKNMGGNCNPGGLENEDIQDDDSKFVDPIVDINNDDSKLLINFPYGRRWLNR